MCVCLIVCTLQLFPINGTNDSIEEFSLFKKKILKKLGNSVEIHIYILKEIYMKSVYIQIYIQKGWGEEAGGEREREKRR